MFHPGAGLTGSDGRLRLIVAAFGDAGHAFPAIALGRELAERGHEVLVETWERWREPIEELGLGFAAPEDEHRARDQQVEQPLTEKRDGEQFLKASRKQKKACANRCRPGVPVWENRKCRNGSEKFSVIR